MIEGTLNVEVEFDGDGAARIEGIRNALFSGRTYAEVVVVLALVGAAQDNIVDLLQRLV